MKIGAEIVIGLMPLLTVSGALQHLLSGAKDAFLLVNQRNLIILSTFRLFTPEMGGQNARFGAKYAIFAVSNAAK